MNRLNFQFAHFPGDFEDRRVHVVDYVFRCTGSRSDAEALGDELGKALLLKGAGDILRRLYAQQDQ